VAAGHNAESELLTMATKASEASRTATAAAKEALNVFIEAFDAVKKATVRPASEPTSLIPDLKQE
jgi:hypothetical protein